MKRADVAAAIKAARALLVDAEACQWRTVPPLNRSKAVVVRECRATVADLERRLAKMPAPKKKPKTATD